MNTDISYSRGTARALLCDAAVMCAMFLSQAAVAQDSAAAAGKSGETKPAESLEQLEEIVVTGTSIRGVQPIGQSLIEVDRADVENTGAITVQDVLATVPQLATFNSAPAPGANSAGVFSTAPNIHGLGQSQTLALLNGHRIVGAGHLQSISDPSSLPPSAVERIEIIADGGSAIYGSDANAGVVNIITRRDYDGADTRLSYGVGDDFDAINASQVFGMTWSSGFLLGSVEYSKQDAVLAADRSDFINADLTSRGGLDYRSTFCKDPNVTIGSTTYAFPALQPNTLNLCNNELNSDLYPEQERISGFLSGRQQLSDTVELFGDLVSSSMSSETRTKSGVFSSVISSSNPFFRAPPGTGATSETIQFNLANVLGPYVTNTLDIDLTQATLGADFSLPRAFLLTAYVTGGRSETTDVEPDFDPAALAAGLAGTTTQTAVDPFGNGTSQAVRNAVANYAEVFGSKQSMYEGNLKLDGPLFDVAAGSVRVAVGGVFRHETYEGMTSDGPFGSNQNLGTADTSRDVYSGFAELYVPFFSRDNARPGLQRLDLSLAARYDEYSDFGSTTNPKFGINWSPVSSLTFRGSYGESFHAPPLPDLHAPDTRALYFPAGSLGLFLHHPSFTSPVNIIALAGGNPGLDPETAETKSFGVDFYSDAWPGFRASVTYYDVVLKGLIGFPDLGKLVFDPAYAPLITLNPTPAQVDAFIAGQRLIGFPVPPYPAIGELLDVRRQNFAEIDTNGLDISLVYQWDTSIGQWQATLAGNRVLQYDTKTVPTAVTVDAFEEGQIKEQFRLGLSWRRGPLSAFVAWNHSGSYHAPYTTTANTQALDSIDAFNTIAVHMGWELPGASFLSGMQLTLDVANLLDEEPPSARQGEGNGGYGKGNVLGRVVTVGLSKSW